VLVGVALVACAPSVDRVLPSPPAGATAVAIISTSPVEGLLLRLPIEGAIVLPSGSLEAHFYGDSFPIALSARAAVIGGATCDAQGLPPTIASFALDAAGAHETQPRPLRAPDLACASAPPVSLAPYSVIATCRNATVTAGPCALLVDRSLCDETSTLWPTMLDGTPCGPGARDEVCGALTNPLPPQALAAGICGDAVFALYPQIDPDPAIEVTTIDLAATIDRITDPYERNMIALLVTPDRLRAVVGPVANRDRCDDGRPTRLLTYDRRTRTSTIIDAPRCLVQLHAQPDGGFLAVFRPENGGLYDLSIGRFTATGTLAASEALIVPDVARAADISSPRVLGLVAAPGPDLTLMFAGDNVDDGNHSVLVLERIDPVTLRPLMVATVEAYARAAEYDPATHEIVVVDNIKKQIRFFATPIADPIVEHPPLYDEGPLMPDMQTLLVASDREVWMAGTARQQPTVDVYHRRGRSVAAARAVFVREPSAWTNALFRVGPTRALGLFHTGIGGTDFDPSGPLWASTFAFDDPSAIVPGVSATAIGAEMPSWARIEDDGLVWVLLSRARQIVSLRAR